MQVIVCGVTFPDQSWKPRPYLRYSNGNGITAEWVGPQCKTIDQAYFLAMQKMVQVKKTANQTQGND